MKYLGIDPGFSGAWGMIDHLGQYIACGEMHHTDKYILTKYVLDDIFQAIDKDDIEVVVEAVHSMPKQGVASSFKFGVAYGGALAIAERLNCAWHMVTPQVWKKALKLNSDKHQSLSLARELWPTSPITKVKDNGKAEALLLALWLRNQNGND